MVISEKAFNVGRLNFLQKFPKVSQNLTLQKYRKNMHLKTEPGTKVFKNKSKPFQFLSVLFDFLYQLLKIYNYHFKKILNLKTQNK